MSEDLKELAANYNIDSIGQPEANKDVSKTESELLESLGKMSDDEFNLILPHLNALLNTSFQPINMIVETEEERRARMDAVSKRMEEQRVRIIESNKAVAEHSKYKHARYAKYLEAPTWKEVLGSIKWHINLGREKRLPLLRTINGIKYAIVNKIRRSLGVTQTKKAIKNAWRKHAPSNPMTRYLRERAARKFLKKVNIDQTAWAEVLRNTTPVPSRKDLEE